jgi:parallel beta-helix repeat protein
LFLGLGGEKLNHARKTLTLLFLFVTPLLFSGIITMIPTSEIMATTTPTTTRVNTLSYDSINAIWAYNDFDLSNYASALSWEGDGSPGDPYIIEGYSIVNDSNCIEIRDVSLAFEIRNCYIESELGISGDGIYIDNATQVAIYDTVIVNKSAAIYIIDAPAPYIENCTMYGGFMGIQVARGNGLTVHECHVYDVLDYGVLFIECNSTLLTNNHIHDTGLGAGIRYDLSHDVTVRGNHIHDCGSSGVWAIWSPFSTIEENIIHSNWFFTGPMCGVHLEFSDYGTILGNEIYDNAMNGVYLVDSDFVEIYENDIYNNSDHGIDAIQSHNATVIGNNIYENGWWPIVVNALCGIYIGFSYGWEVSSNSIWNNTPSGITTIAVDDIEIFENDIFLNAFNGIWAEAGSHVKIVDNTIHENGWDVTNPWEGNGILISSPDSRIEGNLIYDNTNHGIYGMNVRTTVTGNEVFNHPQHGIGTIMSTNYSITENICYDNRHGVFAYSYMTNITDNILYDNYWGVQLYASLNCSIYGNDIGWNIINAQDNMTAPTSVWYDSVTETGNHWHDYDGGGTYWIFNGTHGVSQDMYPSVSLNLTQAEPISYEILETENTVIWEAYALNPSHYEVYVDDTMVLTESWDGGNIEYVADGLSHGEHTIEVEVYHYSNHSLGNSTTADVEDLTPPSDIEGHAHVAINYGESLSVQYSAEDPSGIASWAVNDTANFAIDSTGLLTNVAELEVGDYIVRITVSDTHGHSTFKDVTITVRAVEGGFPTELILIAGGGALAAVVVVIVVVMKKKS